MMKFKRSDFPQDFIFGTATSSYQIEGHSFGGAGPTHWDTFAAKPGKILDGTDGAIACDHYNRWQEDLDLIKDAGFDSYRFSTSWARVMPEGRGAVNQEGLDFYDRLVDGMLARGIKPMATLYHWEMPAALDALGGWQNADVADWFAEFTDVIAKRLGDRLFSTATINEPWCVSWLSHFEGHHAPGLQDIKATARAMHHVLKAHGKSVQVLRQNGVKDVGIVCNFEGTMPADDSVESARAAARYEAIYNRFFLQGIFEGTYPEEVLEGLGPHLPAGWQDDMALIQQPLDWVGVNYYTAKAFRETDGPWPSCEAVSTGADTTHMNWEIHPDHLTKLLKWIADTYTKDLPLYVTENGMAGEHTLNDQDRISYLNGHVLAAKSAMDAGVPLGGYTFWSLMDNYEWAFGYAERFGLVHVDFDTLERTPKASYLALRDAMSQ